MSIAQVAEKACCKVTGSSGAIVSGSNVGVASCTRASAGVYSLVTNRSYDAPVLQLTVLGGAGNANIQCTPNADKVTFAITTFVGAVATDEDFLFSIDNAIS